MSSTEETHADLEQHDEMTDIFWDNSPTILGTYILTRIFLMTNKPVRNKTMLFAVMSFYYGTSTENFLLHYAVSPKEGAIHLAQAQMLV